MNPVVKITIDVQNTNYHTNERQEEKQQEMESLKITQTSAFSSIHLS
jgi:hypothetical protein